MNTQHLTTEEQERASYFAGDTLIAELLGRIGALEAERDHLVEQLEDATSDSLTRWEKENGPVDQYKEFFSDCFARLAGHYPCPSISSDYDKSVIFDAIEKGEEADASVGAA